MFPYRRPRSRGVPEQRGDSGSRAAGTAHPAAPATAAAHAVARASHSRRVNSAIGSSLLFGGILDAVHGLHERSRGASEEEDGVAGVPDGAGAVARNRPRAVGALLLEKESGPFGVPVEGPDPLAGGKLSRAFERVEIVIVEPLPLGVRPRLTHVLAHAE